MGFKKFFMVLGGECVDSVSLEFSSLICLTSTERLTRPLNLIKVFLCFMTLT